MSKKLTSKQQKEQLNNLFAVYNKRLGTGGSTTGSGSVMSYE